jgi:preprotein translocase subunit SecF
VICLLALGIRGLNLGIDFEGGTQWQVTVGAAKADTAAIRDVMSSAGVDNAKVLIIGGDQVRVQAEELRSAERLQVRAALADYAGVDDQEVSVTNVGPTWGQEVTRKAGVALVVFFALIAVYLSWRFEWRMAGSAIVAVIHDIIITAGVYALTQIEVVPATVVAFLTILGFSLYDTVVVFDKIRENESTIGSERGDTYSRMVNRSMNQVLMRSLNTSFVAVLPVFSLLVVGSYLFGALTLRDFALALTVGLITGAYSSIFVATPILAWLKEREPRYIALRERSATQVARERSGAAPVPRAPAAARASAVRAAAPPPSVAEPVADVPAEPVADLPAEPVTAVPAERDGGAPAEAVPATARPASRPEPSPVAPRPRQQRGKKRR